MAIFPINAFYNLLDYSTRDFSPLLSALPNVSNLLGARINGFVDIVRYWLSMAAAFIASIRLELMPAVKNHIVNEPDQAFDLALQILAKIPICRLLVLFINTSLDCMMEFIWLAIALISGIITAPCIMIFMALQDKLQMLRRQTFRDCYMLGMLTFDRFWACTTRLAVIYLIGLEAVPFLYLFYAIASKPPNLWRCGQVTIGYYIVKILVRQIPPPQSWHDFIHAFCSWDWSAMVAHQAVIITRLKAKNTRVVTKYKQDVGEFLKFKWPVIRKRMSESEEPAGLSPSSSSSGSAQGFSHAAGASKLMNGSSGSMNTGGAMGLKSGWQESTITREPGSQDDDENSRFERMYASRLEAESKRIQMVSKNAYDAFTRQHRIDDRREQTLIRELQKELRLAERRIRNLRDASVSVAKDNEAALGPVSASITASNPTGDDDLFQRMASGSGSPSSSIPDHSDTIEAGATELDDQPLSVQTSFEGSQAPSSLDRLENLINLTMEISHSSSQPSSVTSENPSVLSGNAGDEVLLSEPARSLDVSPIQFHTSSTPSTTDAEDSAGLAFDDSASDAPEHQPLGESRLPLNPDLHAGPATEDGSLLLPLTHPNARIEDNYETVNLTESGVVELDHVIGEGSSSVLDTSSQVDSRADEPAVPSSPLEQPVMEAAPRPDSDILKRDDTKVTESNECAVSMPVLHSVDAAAPPPTLPTAYLAQAVEVYSRVFPNGHDTIYTETGGYLLCGLYAIRHSWESQLASLGSIVPTVTELEVEQMDDDFIATKNEMKLSTGTTFVSASSQGSLQDTDGSAGLMCSSLLTMFQGDWRLRP